MRALESQNGFTKQAQNLESTFQQSSHSTTATPRILEEENQASLSLRADNGGEAIHNQKVDSSKQAHFLSLRDFALAKSWQSTPPKTQTLESTFDKTAQNSPSLSSRDFRKEVVAIHSKKVDSSVKVDCHAIATALARNDRKNTTSKKVDSRETAQLNHHDSRICGVASGAFCGFWGRARLEVCGYPKIHKIAAMNTQSRIA